MGVMMPYGQSMPVTEIVLRGEGGIRINEVRHDFTYSDGEFIVDLELSGAAARNFIAQYENNQPMPTTAEAILREEIEGLLQKQAELERKVRAQEEDILDYQGEVTLKQEELATAEKKLVETSSSLTVARNFQDLVMELPVTEVQRIMEEAERRRNDRFFGSPILKKRSGDEAWHHTYGVRPVSEQAKLMKAYQKKEQAIQRELDAYSLDGETL